MQRLLLIALLAVAAFVVPPSSTAQEAKPDASVETAWYTPAELLTALARRDDIRGALPETLAGRALVGKAASTEALLDDACRQWGLAWMRTNGVIVVHRATDERLKKLTASLPSGDRAVAWELGWLRDGRALPALADAMGGSDVALALSAAQAIEVFDTMVPLGRDERVDPVPTGRVSLAAAFLPKVKTDLLDSPYPPIRAAAFRLLLGQGGKPAEVAKTRTANDRSDAVQRVRQQIFPTLPEAKNHKAPMPVPNDSKAIKAACAKMLAQIPDLAKRSEWEQMRWRVRTLAAWSRANHKDATGTLLELSDTKIQQGWFPAYVHMHLASNGSPEAIEKLKQLFAKVERGTLSRGLE